MRLDDEAGARLPVRCPGLPLPGWKIPFHLYPRLSGNHLTWQHDRAHTIMPPEEAPERCQTPPRSKAIMYGSDEIK